MTEMKKKSCLIHDDLFFIGFFVCLFVGLFWGVFTVTFFSSPGRNFYNKSCCQIKSNKSYLTTLHFKALIYLLKVCRIVPSPFQINHLKASEFGGLEHEIASLSLACCQKETLIRSAHIQPLPNLPS